MSDDNATLAMRQRLMTADEVYLYKIPPMKDSGGHRAEDWNLGEPLKTCNLLVERRGDALVLEFQSEGNVFAQATWNVGSAKVAQFLVPVVDSSRYFVVKIQGAGGREALVGFGFRDREQAVDLKESLQHYEKSVVRETESSRASFKSFSIPVLGESEKIHVDVGKGKSKVIKTEKSGSGGGVVPLLGKKPPPPASDKPTPETTVEQIAFSLDGVDLNMEGGEADEDDSGGAVFEGDDDTAGDEDEWKTDFDAK